MDRHLLYGIFLSLFLPAVMIPGAMVLFDWRDYKEFQHFFDEASVALNEVSTGEKEAINATYKENVEAWNKRATTRMDRLFTVFGDDGNPEIPSGISVLRNSFKEILSLRSEFAFHVAPLFSAEIQDPKTLADRHAYEWRVYTLNEIDEYFAHYPERLNEKLDAFRELLLKSGLPEKHEKYVWQQWYPNNKDVFKSLTPDIEYFKDKAAAYKRYFEFMHTHMDGYYITDEGKVIVTNKRYADEYRSLVQAVGLQG